VLSRSGELRVLRGAGLRIRLPARWATPVLTLSALLCGAAIGAAVFATLWQHEASGHRDAEQALTRERAVSASLAAETRTLRRQLALSRRAVASAARTAAERKSTIAGLDRGASALLAASAPLQGDAASITARSRALSSLIRTLDDDLASLSRYVSGTDTSNLDPAFLQAQLDYLKPSLSKVEAAAVALSDEANGYSQSVRDFVGSASAYAATARRARQR
jgi:hypothetical protein